MEFSVHKSQGMSVYDEWLSLTIEMLRNLREDTKMVVLDPTQSVENYAIREKIKNKNYDWMKEGF